ncbi:MAG: C4-dicarboxylate transporter substrate-binding protein [Betaproteobacteria bacterium]|nr:C4-dicarboxylate transporter substrate-binding protein [Betaproteobacteria bacterium]
MAFALTACTTPPPRQSLTLATAAAGGAFQDYGPAVGRVIAAHAPIDLTFKVTDGSNENVKLLNDAAVPLALVNMGPAYQGWTGTGQFRGTPMTNMRAVVPMYETPFHGIALRASGLDAVAKLDGRRVGVGPAGGPGEVFFRGLAEIAGIKPVVVTGSPAENVRQMQAREIDAVWFGAGIPIAAFKAAADTVDAVVFGPTPAQSQAFRERYRYVAPYIVPANTYRGQGADIATFAVWNFVLVHKDVSADTVYAITCALLDHPDEVARAYGPAAATVSKNAAANTFMPFHPGAARYYREHKVELKPELLAP